MNHDGYVATVELDEDAGVLHGRVVNTQAVLTFEGASVDELKHAFADTYPGYACFV
jgi:predicted HicB family RNase H-like nuclease